MPYSKVLVPAGGSKNLVERSLKALAHAIPLCSGEIILLNVTDPLPGTVGGEAREQLMRQERAAAEEALRPLVNAIAEKGKHCRILVENGTVADTSIRMAHEQEADIIVMFTDGRDDVSSLLIGSNTERVLRNTDIPLLAIRR